MNKTKSVIESFRNRLSREENEYNNWVKYENNKCRRKNNKISNDVENILKIFDDDNDRLINKILNALKTTGLNIRYHIIPLDIIGLSSYISAAIQSLYRIKALFEEIIRCCGNDIKNIKCTFLRNLLKIIIIFWVSERFSDHCNITR